jgi:PAS domain S-box-containing protein
MKSQSKIILVGILAFFALAYFIWNTFQNAGNAESMRQWVDHSYQVMEKIDHLSASISQLESDARGWLLTHQETYTTAAQEESNEIDQILRDLYTLTADNPPYQQQIVQLSNQVSEKVQFHLSQMQPSTSRGAFSPERGKDMMDAITASLEQLRAEENRRLQIRIANDRQFVRRGFITTLSGTIAALIFITIILWQLNTDIQRRKRAELELKQFQFRSQAILDNIPLMIQVKDLDGRYLLVNEKLKKTFSFTDEMLLGKTDHDVEPQHAIEYERTDDIVAEQDKPMEIDETVQINNEEHHFHYVKFPLRDQSGKVFAVGGFGIDVTERNRAAQELKSSEQKMRALLSSTNEGFFMVDKNYNLILINEAGKAITQFNTGKTPEMGNSLKQIIGNERRDSMIKTFQRAFEGQSSEYEQVFENSNGEKRTYLMSYLPVKEGEQVIAACVVSKDITDLVIYRAQLIEARRKAERAEKSQEQFLANMSHEIRTPLNGIIGMANLMQNTRLNEEQKEFVNIIKYSSDNLLVLINDILDFSKIKAGKLNIELIEFNIWDVVQKAVTALQQRAKEKDLGLLIFFHDDVPRLIKGDPYRLNQILSNLLSNAIKFTSKGYVRIEISCKQVIEGWCNMRFKIKDTGIGIATEKLAMIFESFSQASEDVTRKFGGTGLGLTITKQLVELQGGTIRVESEEGVGTSVTFEIPYEIIEEPLMTPRAQDETASFSTLSFNGKKILVVEDNDINRKVIAYNLEPTGIEITMANDGKEAVKILEQGNQFDLIIMDLQMPAMNGFQATVYIRQKLKLQTPIIAMTASALKNEEVKCLQLGMNEYLTKPFAPEELFKLLEKYFDGKKMETEKNAVASRSQSPSYSLDYISVKKKPEVISHVLSIILSEAPKLLQEISNAISNEDWKESQDKSHKLKSSIGLLQAKDILELLDKIEIYSTNKLHLEQLPVLIESAIDKFNLLKPMLEAEYEAAAQTPVGGP